LSMPSAKADRLHAFKDELKNNILFEFDRKQEQQNNRTPFLSGRLFKFMNHALVTAFALPLFVLGSVSSYAYYSPTVYNGHILYPVKLSIEKMEYDMLDSASGRVEKKLELAERRLQEVQAQINDNKGLDVATLSKVADYTLAAMQEVQNVDSENEKIALQTEIESFSDQQLTVLASLEQENEDIFLSYANQNSKSQHVVSDNKNSSYEQHIETIDRVENKNTSFEIDTTNKEDSSNFDKDEDNENLSLDVVENKDNDKHTVNQSDDDTDRYNGDWIVDYDPSMTRVNNPVHSTGKTDTYSDNKTASKSSTIKSSSENSTNKVSVSDYKNQSIQDVEQDSPPSLFRDTTDSEFKPSEDNVEKSSQQLNTDSKPLDESDDVQSTVEHREIMSTNSSDNFVMDVAHDISNEIEDIYSSATIKQGVSTQDYEHKDSVEAFHYLQDLSTKIKHVDLLETEEKNSYRVISNNFTEKNMSFYKPQIKFMPDLSNYKLLDYDYEYLIQTRGKFAFYIQSFFVDNFQMEVPDGIYKGTLEIFYTKDNSDPFISDTRILYNPNSLFEVDRNITLKMVAVSDHFVSPVYTVQINIVPTTQEKITESRISTSRDR